MLEVLAAGIRAARDLTRRDILWQAVWPALVAVAVWSAIAVAVWTPMSLWLLERLPEWSWLDWLGAWLVHVALFLALAPLVYFTVLLLVATFSLPRIMAIVAARDYPGLARYGSGAAAFWGSLGNTLAAGAVFVAGWLLCLPLLLIPGAILVLPLVWAAWLNQRTFRFDVLAEHATAEERKMLVESERSRFYQAGLVSALAAHVPVLNFIAPAFAALLFVHLSLPALARLRAREGVWLG